MTKQILLFLSLLAIASCENDYYLAPNEDYEIGVYPVYKPPPTLATFETIYYSELTSWKIKIGDTTLVLSTIYSDYEDWKVKMGTTTILTISTIWSDDYGDWKIKLNNGENLTINTPWTDNSVWRISNNDSCLYEISRVWSDNSEWKVKYNNQTILSLTSIWSDQKNWKAQGEIHKNTTLEHQACIYFIPIINRILQELEKEK